MNKQGEKLVFLCPGVQRVFYPTNDSTCATGPIARHSTDNTVILQ